MIQVTLSFSIPSTYAPKATVYVPHIGSPVITYYPVNISIPGLKSGDTYVSGITTSSGNNDIQIVSISDDTLVIQNYSTSINETVYGTITVDRSVEPFKAYSANTDVNGYVSINHGLFFNPTKWLVTSAVTSANDPITMCFVSSDATSITFRAFVGMSPLVSSAVNFSLYAG